MPVERPHLLIPPVGPRYTFSTKGGGGKTYDPPPVANRRQASRRILQEVESLVRQAVQADDPFIDDARLPMTVRATTAYGVNDSVPGSRRNEILSVSGFARQARVNVAFDPDTIENFEAAAEKYVGHSAAARRKPNHFNFFEALPSVGMTTVADLWVSQNTLPAMDEEMLWEVWLQPAAEPRFREALEMLSLRARRAVAFNGIRVIGLVATRRSFESIARGASISQLRPASSLNGVIFQVPSGVQVAAVRAAARRVTAASEDAPAVCVLDTGIKADHPMLSASVGHCGVVGGGGADDWDGHGTQMAGLALFEDLASMVAERGDTRLAIGIESVAVQSAPGAQATGNLPAERVRLAVDQVEAASARARTFCFAMNAPDETDDGGPSSLSSEIDVLASDVANPRLFCVAAGNLNGTAMAGDYASLNDTSGIMSPAQAWNALTVGACTNLVSVPDTHLPVAEEGDLCPWSRTAVNWERRHKPPSKPDVVFEGGNQMIDGVSSVIGPHVDLSLMTTSSDPAAPLTLTGQTSAATAAVAGLCANLQAEYPMLWPETIRGLVVHSCEHTPAMTARAAAAAGGGVSEQQALLERFGYGRPDRARAMENAADALTLMIQGTLRPLRMNDAGSGAVLGQMRYHRLPWSGDVLRDLGDVPAELRVTLSYFVEPNPGAVIRGDVDLYASHGLDFDVKRPDESEEQAIGRVNGMRPAPRRSTAATLDWRFAKFRGRGGVKHDRLSTTAGEIARMDGVTVLPRKGWWGSNVERVEQQIRYALIVTIKTPEEEIYSEIANAVAVVT